MVPWTPAHCADAEARSKQINVDFSSRKQLIELRHPTDLFECLQMADDQKKKERKKTRSDHDAAAAKFFHLRQSWNMHCCPVRLIFTVICLE